MTTSPEPRPRTNAEIAAAAFAEWVNVEPIAPVAERLAVIAPMARAQLRTVGQPQDAA
jgi:hypothetical protein